MMKSLNLDSQFSERGFLYNDQSVFPVDQDFQFSEPEQNQEEVFQFKTIFNTAFNSTKASTKPMKGRPKKREKQSQNLQNHNILFSEHEKTIFSLPICYTFKALVNYPKFNRFGLLHDKIVKQDDFYESCEQAVKVNKLFDSNEKSTINKYLSNSVSLKSLVEKLLWLAPLAAMDEILYILSEGLQFVITKFDEYKSDDDNQIYEELLDLVKRFTLLHGRPLMDKLKWINFKNPKLKIQTAHFEHIYCYFLEFIEVLVTSAVLVYKDFMENPFFTTYYSSDIDSFGASTLNSSSKRSREERLISVVEQKEEQAELEYDENYKKTKTEDSYSSTNYKDLPQDLPQDPIYEGDQFD